MTKSRTSRPDLNVSELLLCTILAGGSRKHQGPAETRDQRSQHTNSSRDRLGWLSRAMISGALRILDGLGWTGARTNGGRSMA